MRARLLLLALCALTGCRVDVTGAACKADPDCPTGQHCGAGKCTDQPTASATAGSSGSTASASSTGSISSSGTSGSAGSTGGSGSSGTGSTGSTGSASSGSSGSTGVVCPDNGDVAGAGCTFRTTRKCAGTAILECTEVDAGSGQTCKVLQPVDDCGELTCWDFLGAAGCKCPDATGAVRYVDGVEGSYLDGGPGKADGGHVAPATGVQSPTRCRFRTLGDALGASGVTHVTVTTDIPHWQSATSYRRGDRVRPSYDNGSYYRATAAGLSGLAEPGWLSDGGTTPDDSLVWEEAGSFIYPDETLPLRVQSGQTLDTSACPAGGTAPCSPLLAVLANTSAGVSPTLQLEAGGSLSGLAVLQVAVGGSDGVACSSNGTATLANTWVIGNDRLANCFAARSGCGLDGGALVAGGCHTGLLVTGNGATHLTEAVLGSAAALGTGLGDLPNQVGVRSNPGATGSLVLERCIVAGNDAGVEVTGDTQLHACAVAYNNGFGITHKGATLTVADGGIIFNGKSGITVEGGTVVLQNEVVSGNKGNGVNLGNSLAVTDATVRNTTISNNLGTGLAVQHANQATMDLSFLDIFGNASAASGQDQCGVLLDNAGSMTRFQGNTIHGNTGPQIRVTRQPAVGDWDLRGNGCTSRPNAVYCYSGSNESIGISNEAGGNVKAAYYFWQQDPPVAGNILGLGYHDYAGGVDLTNSSGADATCGVANDGGC